MCVCVARLLFGVFVGNIAVSYMTRASRDEFLGRSKLQLEAQQGAPAELQASVGAKCTR